jgi:ribonuclease HII
MAGVAILPDRLKGRWVKLVRDSKQMTAAQRDYVLPYLQDVALALEVGASSPEEIDSLGIVAATRLAMQRALDSVTLLPQFLLLDAITLPQVSIPQKAIIRGDSLCISISAASIVAKVTRDNLMKAEDEMYPGYGFAQHKGYGTPGHMRSLERLGPCAIHRHSFAPINGRTGAC